MITQDDSGDVLSRDSIYKSYELEEVDTLFEDIRRAIEKNGKKTPNEIENGFRAAAISLGTHGPKLANPRSPDKPFTPETTEPEFQKYYSGDGKYGPYAKALLRPISIVGQVGNENFVERLETRGNSTVFLENAFARVFGLEALDAVKAGLERQKGNICAATAHHENYPMIFVPGPDRDLVLTPLSAFSTLRIMQRVKDDGYEALSKAKNTEPADTLIDEGGKPGPTIAVGDYHRTEISDKPQNTAIGIPKHRFRFFTKMPEVLDRLEAEVYSWISGGMFPRMRDPDVVARLERYASLLKTVQEQTLAPSAMSKVDVLADWLIADAHRHIDDIKAEAGDNVPVPPKPAVVLAHLRFSPDSRQACLNALRSAHFQDRVGKFEVE